MVSLCIASPNSQPGQAGCVVSASKLRSGCNLLAGVHAMQTFLIERTVPSQFDPGDADQAALHSRWATDAYREVGAFWYGAVVAGDKMFALVAAEDASVIERYCEILGIDAASIVVRPVDRFLGPTVAMSHSDPRFRPPRPPATNS
jgi:hypothetical protein